MNDILPNAVTRLSIEKFSELLSATQEIEARDAKGRTALFRAARVGRLNHVQLLLSKGADPNAIDSTGESPLQSSVRYSHLECAKLLIDAGAEVNYCPPPEANEYSESALCSAVRKATTELVALLLSRGADPNLCTSARRLPLILAVGCKNFEMVNALVEAGARVNEQDSRGRTALHAAVDVGSITLINYLLSHGADPDIEADNVGTALCGAMLCRGHDQAAIVLALLPARPKLNAVCPSWEMTPIEMARQFKLPEVERILLLAGSPDLSPDFSSGRESVSVTVEAPEGPAVVEFQFKSTPDPEISARDREMARIICESGPSLSRNLGWRSSPFHWQILSILSSNPKPLRLYRIAYFLRGHRNVPEGEELQDGLWFLGESYEVAIKRFIQEGLAESVLDERELERSSFVDDLKELARNHGLNVSGTKADLVSRLIAIMGFEDLCAHLNPERRFSILPAGIEVLADRKKYLDETRETKRREFLKLLFDGEFEWACHIARELDFLGHGNEAYQRLPAKTDLMALRIAIARNILSLPLPPSLSEFDFAEEPLRMISAAAALIDHSGTDWMDWDSEFPPIYSSDGFPIKPDNFSSLILSQDCD
jgi:hypothetical protein